MKKIISVLLAALLLMAVIPAHAVFASSDTAEQSVVLTGDNYKLAAVNSTCNIADNKTVTGTNQYPVFDVTFNDYFLINSITVQLTVAAESGKVRINPSNIYYCETSYKKVLSGFSSAFAAGTTTEQTREVDAEYRKVAVNKLRIQMENPSYDSTNTSVNFTVDSITVNGIQLTETVTMTAEDFTLTNANNCTIEGNVVTSAENKYPSFRLNFGKEYYVAAVSITASPTGRNYTANSSKVNLMYDGTKSVDLGLSTAYWEKDKSTTKSKSIVADSHTILSNGILFAGAWGGSGVPTAGEATVKIDEIKLTYFKNPTESVALESDYTVSAVSNCNVNDKTVTASTLWPKFLVTFPNAYYASSVDVAVKNDYDYGLAWHNGTENYIDLIFEDDTTVSAVVTDTSSNYWKGQVAANTEELVNVVIPEEYRHKRIKAIRMEGYFPATGAALSEIGSITVTGATVNEVPVSVTAEMVAECNNPSTAVAAAASIANAFPLYKNVVLCHMADFAPALNSVAVVDDPFSYYDGMLMSTVAMPSLPTDLADYYLSEVGIVGTLTDTLSGTELTCDIAAAKTAALTASADSGLSGYSELNIPFAGSSDYKDNSVSLRAFAKYTNGIDVIVYYSDNTTEDEKVSGGVSAATLPDEKTVTEADIGDANGDSVVDIIDLIRLKKILTAVSEDIIFMGADVNADGLINSLDLTEMRKALLEVSELPQEPYSDSFVVAGTLANLTEA